MATAAKPAAAPQAGHNEHTFTLIDNATGKKYELPVIGGSIGPKVIDVR